MKVHSYEVLFAPCGNWPLYRVAGLWPSTDDTACEARGKTHLRLTTLHHLRHSVTRSDRLCDELLVLLHTAAAFLRRRSCQWNMPVPYVQQLLGCESVWARSPPHIQKTRAPHTGIFANAEAEAGPHLRKVLPLDPVRRCSIVHWQEDLVG